MTVLTEVACAKNDKKRSQHIKYLQGVRVRALKPFVCAFCAGARHCCAFGLNFSTTDIKTFYEQLFEH